MRILTALLLLSTLSTTGSMTAWAQGGTCGSCPSVGFCPPTFPMGAGPGEDHRCEDHSHTFLHGTILSFADLSSAKFLFAELVSADLSFADLSGASLSNAALNSALFNGADLSNANLIGAQLFNASLSGANFSGADLSGASNLNTTSGSAFYDCATNFTGTGFDPVAAGWALLGAPPCGVCVGVTETVRLGTPPNPNAFLPGLTTGPAIAATWDPVIDHTTFMPAAVFDFVGITAFASNIPLPPLGTLLCDPALTISIESAPAGQPFAVAIPNDCVFVGTNVCTQGASLDALGNILFTNALDITIGTF